MRNLSQSTYARINRKVLSFGLTGARASMQDLKDLLEAYESAVTLLDNLVGSATWREQEAAEKVAQDFLFLDNGEPHVIIEEEKA
jgi:hypothetical protein